MELNRGRVEFLIFPDGEMTPRTAVWCKKYKLQLDNAPTVAQLLSRVVSKKSEDRKWRVCCTREVSCGGRGRLKAVYKRA